MWDHDWKNLYRVETHWKTEMMKIRQEELKFTDLVDRLTEF